MSRRARLWRQLWLALAVSSALLPARLAIASPQPPTVEISAPDYEYFGIDADPRTGTVYAAALGGIYRVKGQASVKVQGTGFDIEPRLSPDGRMMAFIGTDDSAEAVSGRPQLYLVDLGSKILTKLPVGDLETHKLAEGGLLVEPYLRGETNPPWHWWQTSVRFPVWARSGKAVFASILRADARDVIREYDLVGKRHHDWDIAAFEGFDVGPDDNCLYVATDKGIERIDRAGKRETIYRADGARLFRPRVAPDGTKLIFIREKGGQGEFVALDLATGVLSHVVPISDRPIEPAPELTRSLHPARGMFPAYGFLNGGKAILFADQGRLSVADLRSGKSKPFGRNPAFKVALPERPPVPRHRIFGEHSLKSIDYPAWSADQRSILFSALGHVWKYDGQKSARLTDAQPREYMPSLSRDGTSALFVRWNDETLGQIVERSIDTGTEKIVSPAPGRYYGPSFTPDRRFVIALKGSSDPKETPSQYYGKPFEIVKIALDTGTETPVTSWGKFLDSSAGVLLPKVQPAGSNLIFFDKFVGDGNRGGHFILYSVNLDGTDRKIRLKLSPDTSRIVVSPGAMRAAAFASGQVSIYDIGAETPAMIARADGVSANYAQWIDDTTLAWSFGNQFSRWRPGSGEAPRKQVVRIDYMFDHAQGEIALVNARLVTMSGTAVIEKGVIVIRDGRIVHVGPNLPRAYSAIRQVNLAGKTIMPGIIDAHAHSHQQSHQDLALLPEHKWGYYGSLAAGVTTLFDPAADDQAVFAQAELVDAGAMLGPRIFSTGKIVGGDNFYLDTPYLYRDISGIEQARRILRERLDLGAIFAKSYRLNRPARMRLNAAARELGIGIALEGRIEDYFDNFRMVTEANTSIEHDPEVGLRSDWIQYLGKSRAHITVTPFFAYWDPAKLPDSGAVADLSGLQRFERFLPPPFREENAYRLTSAQQAPLNKHLEPLAASLKRLQQAGAELSYGAHAAAGAPIHFDFWQLASAGFSNNDILEMATINGARKLGLAEDLGSIERGKIADLVILNGNPLADIFATADIAYVVKGGRIYDGPTLRELFPQSGQCHYFSWFDKGTDPQCGNAEIEWKKRIK